jgi:hypothetical protein
VIMKFLFVLNAFGASKAELAEASKAELVGI